MTTGVRPATRMRAAVIDGPHSVSVVTLDGPRCGPDDVVVRIAYVGLCGTDLELLHGTSSYLADGRTSFPHHFGHEWVGTVAETGRSVVDLTPGHTVTGSTMIFCGSCAACSSGRRNLCTHLSEVGLYRHSGAVAEYLVMPRRAVVSLGEPAPEAEHVLIEPLVTVLEAIDIASVSPGDRVLVIGAGTIGSLAITMLSQYPVAVEALEPRCIDHLDPDTLTARFTTAADLPGDYDVVVEASGGVGALGTAIGALRPGGRCVLVGVAAQAEPIDPGVAALNGISITGVRHGVDHYRQAAAIYPQVRPSLTSLIDGVVPLSDIKNAFDRLERRRTRPKVVIALA